jgi:hypothetical protein
MRSRSPGRPAPRQRGNAGPSRGEAPKRRRTVRKGWTIKRTGVASGKPIAASGGREPWRAGRHEGIGRERGFGPARCGFPRRARLWSRARWVVLSGAAGRRNGKRATARRRVRLLAEDGSPEDETSRAFRVVARRLGRCGGEQPAVGVERCASLSTSTLSTPRAEGGEVGRLARDGNGRQRLRLSWTGSAVPEAL